MGAEGNGGGASNSWRASDGRGFVRMQCKCSLVPRPQSLRVGSGNEMSTMGLHMHTTLINGRG